MNRRRCSAGLRSDAQARARWRPSLASSRAVAGAPRPRPQSPRAGLAAAKTSFGVLLACAVLLSDTVPYASGAAQRSSLGERGRATPSYRPAGARLCRRAGFVPSLPPCLSASKARTCSHRPGNAGARTLHKALALVRHPLQSLLMLQHGGDGHKRQEPLVPTPDVPTAIWSELKAHVLKRILKRAVVHERYEQAARLKDELGALNSLLMQVLRALHCFSLALLFSCRGFLPLLIYPTALHSCSSVLYAVISPEGGPDALGTWWRAGARGQPPRPGFSDAQTSASVRRASAPDRSQVVHACARAQGVGTRALLVFVTLVSGPFVTSTAGGGAHEDVEGWARVAIRLQA